MPQLADLPASFPSGRRWYAVYTHIRAEGDAGKAIHELGYETFVPQELSWRVYRGRRIQAARALFPRYGFVQFDINRDEWGAVVETKDVIDLVRTCNIPRPIPDQVIEALQLAENIGVFDRTQPPRAGSKVEVTEGPFTGIIGKLRRARSYERWDIVFDCMGVETMANIPLAYLREA